MSKKPYQPAQQPLKSTMKIETTIDYIAALRPQFKDEIRGCSAEDISRLEQIFGRPVPPVYRSFLSYMGHDIGGIKAFYAGCFICQNVDFSWKRVLQLEIKAKQRLPPRFTLIGETREDPFESICLDEESSLHEPRVLRCTGGRDPGSAKQLLQGGGFEVALSLPEMLFAAAFLSFAFARHRVSVEMSQPERQPDGLRAADKLMRRMDFEQHPASSGWTHFYTRADAVALVYQNTKHPLQIEMRAQRLHDARRWSAILVDHLGILGSSIRELGSHEA